MFLRILFGHQNFHILSYLNVNWTKGRKKNRRVSVRDERECVCVKVRVIVRVIVRVNVSESVSL